MTVISDPQISLDELRTLVLEAFKKSPETQYVSLCNSVAQLAVQKGMMSNPQQGIVTTGNSYKLTSHDEDRVREIIWDLIVSRLVTIGINAENPNWPFLKLTEYGRKVVNSSSPSPHDHSGYLNRLREEVPKIDTVILTYLEESLRTFNIHALLSATITLGCASEKALLLLIEAFGNAIQNTKRKEKFEADTRDRLIKRQFDIFVRNLNGIKGNLPYDITEGVDTMLLGIFEMIRNYRNDAGHPSSKTISREQVYANLQVFISYCKKVYELKNYFETNIIS